MAAADPREAQELVKQAVGWLRYQRRLGWPGTPWEAPSDTPGSAAALAVVPDLPAIRAELGDCQRCKLSRGRTRIVFGEGPPRAALMFIGEGPGEDEDLQGRPFVGDAGQLLNRMLGKLGLRREEVYIANVVKCRPPRNRDPEEDEVSACLPFLKKQIESIRPRVIIALGRVATRNLLATQAPLTRLRGTWQRYGTIPVMPTFHPSYLLRFPKERHKTWEDMQRVMEVLRGNEG